MSAPVYATRDAILHGHRFPGRSFASTDHGGMYEVLGSAGPGRAFVVGDRGKLLAMVTRTGRVEDRGYVRVRFDFAVDTGDRDGTLRFEEHRRGSCGGVAPAGLFTR